MTNEISDLLREGYAIKARMAADKERLAAINAKLLAAATFPINGKTAHMAANGYAVKVQLRETVSWDQKALRKAVNAMGVKEFQKAFDYEYKPKSAKDLNAYMMDPATPDEYRALISAARMVKPTSLFPPTSCQVDS